MKPTDDELEAMAREMLQEHRTLCLMAGAEPDVITTPAKRAAAMLRARKAGDVPDQGEWNMDESEYGTLIYSLKQDGWRKGEPIMVNDVTIRIENANRSSHDLGPIAARILAALEPAPDHSEWNAAIEAVIVNLKTYAPHQDDTGPEHDIGYAAGYHTALNRLSALKKGPSHD